MVIPVPRRSVRFVSLVLTILTILWGGLSPREVAANFIDFTASGSSSSGSLAAQITFTAINGGIEITMTNLASGTITKGQAISALSFTVGGGLNMPTAFSQLTGFKANSSSFVPGSAYPGSAAVTPFSDTSTTIGAGAIDHWGFQPSGSNVKLATAGSSVSGATGNPHYMILPSTGITGSGSSLKQGNFDPYVIGPAHFFLSVAGVTENTQLASGNYRNVKVGFGTGPDTTLGAIAVPEPSSVVIVIGVTGLLGAAGLWRRWRRGPESESARESALEPKTGISPR